MLQYGGRRATLGVGSAWNLAKGPLKNHLFVGEMKGLRRAVLGHFHASFRECILLLLCFLLTVVGSSWCSVVALVVVLVLVESKGSERLKLLK